MPAADDFRRAPPCIAKGKIAGLRILHSVPALRFAAGAGPAPDAFVAIEMGAMGAPTPEARSRHDRWTPDTAYEPHHIPLRPITCFRNSSSTATVPSKTTRSATASGRPASSPAASPTSSTPSWWRSPTPLEPDLEELLWGTVNLFHRATDRIERTRRQRDRSAPPARTGWLGGPSQRTRTPDGTGARPFSNGATPSN